MWCVCVCVYICVIVCVYTCVCVCVRKREGQGGKEKPKISQMRDREITVSSPATD